MTDFVSLGSVATVEMGLSPPGSTYNSEEIGMPLLNGPTEFGSSHPVPSLYTIDPKRKARMGDILFCVRGSTTGRMNWADQDYAIGRGIAAIRAATPLETRYVKYCVDLMLRELLQQASGSTFPNLSRRDITSLLIPYRADRLKIAAILSAYDDLVENNRRRIRLLEEMAQRIYREWFVDFRYPGHVDIGLKDSELGPIPKDWAIGTLGDLVLLQRGFDLPTQHRRKGGVPVASATGISGSHDVSRVTAPGVVTGRSGSIGTVQYLHDDFWPLNTTLWVKDFRLATPQFAVFVLRSIDLVSFNSGAAVPTLNRNDLATFRQVLPPRPLIARFSVIAREMLDAQAILGRSTENMRTTRDLLLPRLVSGEIDVDHLNIEIPEAA
jgi:type I restriction enzyme S subunit